MELDTSAMHKIGAAMSNSSVDLDAPEARRRAREAQHLRSVVKELLGDDAEWQENALCSQTDPERFFPEKGSSNRDAKLICGRCEVKAECLEYALRRDERFGVWGGLSERERRKLKRRAV